MSDRVPDRCHSSGAADQPLAVPDEPAAEPPEGGDPACWVHLVCPECGAVAGESHRPECESAPRA